MKFNKTKNKKKKRKEKLINKKSINFHKIFKRFIFISFVA